MVSRGWMAHGRMMTLPRTRRRPSTPGPRSAKHIPRFSGQFSLHGHSAGAQFAARYLVTHPSRLEAVVLSAPGAYPFPDPALPWPNGMAAVVRDELSGSADDGKA